MRYSEYKNYPKFNADQKQFVAQCQSFSDQVERCLAQFEETCGLFYAGLILLGKAARLSHEAMTLMGQPKEEQEEWARQLRALYEKAWQPLIEYVKAAAEQESPRPH